MTEPAPGRAEGWEKAINDPLSRIPHPAALLLLLALVAACIWSVFAVSGVAEAGEARAEAQRAAVAAGGSGDLDLYRAIDLRVAHGENYYSAAVSEQIANDYPTVPFFTVRTPVMAWGAALFGLQGWRLIAIAVLGLALASLTGALAARRSVAPERIAAPVLVVLCGIAAFQEWIGLVHELMSGLFLTLALYAYRPGRWWPSLLALAVALAIRELALPFALLWLAFAALERRWKEFFAVLGVVACFAVGMALHAQAVIAVRPPGALPSPGWIGMLGPQAFLEAMVRLTPLTFLPVAVAAPLALLPLLGWFGMGGRLGLFAALWFAGFGLAIALFARPENFYWGAMVLPAYAAGLAFAPRAFWMLVRTGLGKPAAA